MRRNSNGISARVLVMAVALTLIIGGIIGGSVAWLAVKTDPVVNTFTVGDINITLTETGATQGDGKYTKDYTVTPGVNLFKDPKVIVEAGSEPCWLFIKVDAVNWPDSIVDGSGNRKIDYKLVNTWTPLPGCEGVYYQDLTSKTTENTDYKIIVNDEVTVSKDLTKEDLKKITGSFSLTFKAYAIQKDSFDTVDKAWAEVSK